MSIVEYIDPKNKRHVEAFQHLRKNGTLPHDFCTEACEAVDVWPAYWIDLVMAKFADAHCEFFLNCDLYSQMK